jgi:hypothetical protein
LSIEQVAEAHGMYGTREFYYVRRRVKECLATLAEMNPPTHRAAGGTTHSARAAAPFVYLLKRISQTGNC